MSSIAKVIELIAESDVSFDDAVDQALVEAKKTVDDIKSIWIENMTAVVEDGEIERYRVNAKVTFLVHGRE